MIKSEQGEFKAKFTKTIKHLVILHTNKTHVDGLYQPLN